MAGEPASFEKPLYISSPLLPSIDDYVEKLKEIWQSRWLTNNGAQHNKLESMLMKQLKVPNLSLFNNGTIALIIACRALRLSGEVITTPFTFPATPHVLVWNGIVPVFCDIDEQTLNIDTKKIEMLITPKTSAILGVHVFGRPCDVYGIEKIAKFYGLKVIYDAAHVFNVEIDGKGIGTFGDISMFSFHATKMFHTAEGGCLTFNDPDLKKRIDFLKNFGIKNEEEVIMPGINGKMNELQAALGISVIEILEQEIQKRKTLFGVYKEHINIIDGITICSGVSETMPQVLPNYQYMVVRVNKQIFGKNRNELHSALKKYNVITRKYFYPLCSEYACYRQHYSSSKVHLPAANTIADEVLCLPLYGALSVSDAEKICDIIKYIKEH
ncbi:MAG: DegT/DnrJ/EryC1/StrS family aminotransferase [Nitrospirae bacterium YQR-1]